MAKTVREKVQLACQECKRRNYFITKNKKLHSGRIELSKYCPWDRKHTTHKEVK